jgi:hydrogenase maturation protease
VVVVGLGDLMRGDDAAGLLVARRMRQREPRIEVVETPDVAACLDVLRRGERVIVVDAMRSGAPAGTVRRIDVREEPLPASFSPGSTHALDLGTAVELARALGTLPRRTVVYGIEGARFRLGEAVSPEVLAAVARVVEAVLAERDAAAEPAEAEPCTS